MLVNKINFLKIGMLLSGLGLSMTLMASPLPKVLIIDSSNAPIYAVVHDTFVKELDHLGYQPGRNIELQTYSLGLHEKKMDNIWALEGSKDYVATFLNGTSAVEGAASLAMDAPGKSFIFTTVANPLELGILKSCHEAPNHNFTGVCLNVDIPRMMRLIKENMPQVKRLGILYADTPQSKYCLQVAQKLLATDPFKYMSLEAREISLIKSDMGQLRMVQLAENLVKEMNNKVDMYIPACDHLNTFSGFVQMLGKTATVPFFGISYESVMQDKVAVMSIFPDLKDAAKKSAQMVDQLIKGKKLPELMPQVTGTDIAVNLNNCKKYGIQINEATLKEAGANVISQ